MRERGISIASSLSLQTPLPSPAPEPWKHPTSNAQHPIMAQTRVLGCSMLDVRCWVFSFFGSGGQGAQSPFRGILFPRERGHSRPGCRILEVLRFVARRGANLPLHGTETSNIQHPTSNAQHPMTGLGAVRERRPGTSQPVRRASEGYPKGIRRVSEGASVVSHNYDYLLGRGKRQRTTALQDASR